MVEQFGFAAAAALGVVAHHARTDFVAIEQPSRQPRVLGGDERHRLEYLDGPVREVSEIADRSGDDEEPPSASATDPPLSTVVGRPPTSPCHLGRGVRAFASAAGRRPAHRRADPGRRRG